MFSSFVAPPPPPVKFAGPKPAEVNQADLAEVAFVAPAPPPPPPPMPAPGGLGKGRLAVAKQQAPSDSKYQFISLPMDKMFAALQAPMEHPWKIIVRKTFIEPGQPFDDEKDVDLSFLEIKKALKEDSKFIPKDKLDMIKEIVDREQKLLAIQTAAQFPRYFSQKYLLNEENIIKDMVNFWLDQKGISFTKHDSDELILYAKFDDINLLPVKQDSFSIMINDSEYKLKSTTRIASFVHDHIKKYISQLKSKATLAVGLTTFGPLENGFIFSKGNLIEIIDRDSVNGWLHGQLGGKTGWFPLELVELVLEPPQVDTAGRVTLKGEMLKRSDELESKRLQVKPSVTGSNANRLSTIGGDSISSMASGSIPDLAQSGASSSTQLGGASTPTSPTAGKEATTSSDKLPQSPTQQPQFSLVEWGKQNFNFDGTASPTKSFFGTLSRSATMKVKKAETELIWKEIVTKLKWRDTPIKAPMNKVADKADAALAVEVFSNIMQYMGDLPTKMTRYESVFFVVNVGMRKPVLADEIYCQVIKQTTNNKSRKEDSAQRGWYLLVLLCTFVIPSAQFEPYLTHHLQSVASHKERSFSDMGEMCLERLKRNKASARTMPPSQEEVECVEEKKKHLFRIQTADGNQRSYVAESHTLAKDIIKNICERYEIKTPEHYALYVTFDPGDYLVIPVLPTDKIPDILGSANLALELNRNVGKVEFSNVKLIFARKIWFRDNSKPSEAAKTLLYYHVEQLFLSGAIFTDVELRKEFRENVAMIIALILHFRRVDLKNPNHKNFIPSVIPSGFLTKEWDTILERCTQRVEKLKPNETVHMFLDQMKQWKAYGYALFKSSSSNDSRFSGGCIIGVGSDGVRIIDKSNRSFIETFSFENIMNFRYDEKEFVLRSSAGQGPGGKMLLRFETRQGFVIADLINSYIEIISKEREKSGSKVVNLLV